LIHVTVVLETGRAIRTVREEDLPALRPIYDAHDLAWHADQYAQETIGSDLALEGWEVIGGGEIPEIEPGALARSATYAVRRLGWSEP
jgi:hypothetical protein